MARSPDEWMRQAHYDLATAQAMFDARRYFYAVFMCHLALEKGLKGLYQARLKQIPPKTHDLVFLKEATSPSVNQQQDDFLYLLSRYGVTTRYPEELQKLINEFPRTRTRGILALSKETVRCLQKELRK